MTTAREIALDTETTGLDPLTGHRIVEIGCVELVNRIRTGTIFHYYINPEREIPKEATAIHGLTSGFLMDKPLFSHVAKEFLAFIGNDPLVIHNAGFDMKFLNHELQRMGLNPIQDNPIVDTLYLARGKFPGSPASLDALCRRFKIDLSRRDKHGALLDAELLADVYAELTGGRQVSLVLEQEEIVTDGSATLIATIKQTVREQRVHAPTEKEILAHQYFLKKLKKPMWAEE